MSIHKDGLLHWMQPLDNNEHWWIFFQSASSKSWVRYVFGESFERSVIRENKTCKDNHSFGTSQFDDFKLLELLSDCDKVTLGEVGHRSAWGERRLVDEVPHAVLQLDFGLSEYTILLQVRSQLFCSSLEERIEVRFEPQSCTRQCARVLGLSRLSTLNSSLHISIFLSS
uniref:ATP-dependent RNA helicase MAK5 n=1 Tax=Lygus hesperus TaxID=30085 RepID=A0A0A9X3M0_LYGHE